MHLHEVVSHVIGVDTHKDSHTAAVLDARTGGVQGQDTVYANRDGYDAVTELADEHSSAGDRASAIEGTGSYGAGLAEYLSTRGEWVIEIDRPTRPARRDGAKSDDLDAAAPVYEIPPTSPKITGRPWLRYGAWPNGSTTSTRRPLITTGT